MAGRVDTLPTHINNIFILAISITPQGIVSRPRANRESGKASCSGSLCLWAKIDT